MTEPVQIIAKKNGPFLVSGPVRFVDQDGNPIELPPAKTPGTFKLCSCGMSATRPFCDGSHKTKPSAA
ncbi:MAG: CDGSH iron-sulfur domain-containing protein [Gemmatimonadales bacterium]